MGQTQKGNSINEPIMESLVCDPLSLRESSEASS